MPEYQVWYTVPVAVHVDTDTCEVLRVVVIDESMTLDKSQGVTLPDYSGPAPDEDRSKAVSIAESDSPSIPWPVWEFGY